LPSRPLGSSGTFISSNERTIVVTNDIGALLAATRDVAAERIAPDAARVDRERAFPADGLRALAEAGALGLVVPEALGGAGGGLSALAEACEAVGEACASTGMTYLMHSVTAATVAMGGGPRAAEVSASLASGEWLGTLAFSERGTGAHFYSPELKAVRSDGSVTISGRKSFVTSGSHADVYLVLVQGEAEGSADAYLVAGDARGVKFDGDWNGLGMSGNSSIALELDGVEVGDDDRIGAAGGAVDLVFQVVAPFFLVGLAAVNVGIASAAAAAATAHAAGRRYPDGTSLAELPYVQHLIADMDLATRQARLLVRSAAALGDAGDPSALVAIMESKVAATEAAQTVTQKALDATGGQGYTPALPIERHLRDARAGAVMAPTNAVLRNWIGKALAGLPVP
jgi:alkylation response protein AidB-like acyl-CoA dehydrogenase